MEVIPAVDIKEGKCVRLIQGDFNREVIYGEDPIETALYWEQQGARRLHVVDLDGARTGKPHNLELIRNLARKLAIPVQLGGGIRTREIIEQYLTTTGIDRVILGTAALENPALVKNAVQYFGSHKIAVGVDARDGKIAVEGWQEVSEKTVLEIVNEYKKIGVTTFIYTDISKDGMLEGPDITGIKKLVQMEDIEIIASGGISTPEDIIKLDRIGVKKGIVGQALYSGDLKPEDCWPEENEKN